MLGEHLNILAILFLDSNHLGQAERFFRRSLSMREDPVTAFPDIPEYRRRLACVHHNLGLLLCGTRKEEAEKSYRKAIAVLTELVAGVLGTAYRYRLGMVYGDLGIVPIHNCEILARRWELIKKALAIAPNALCDWNSRNWWNTLGVAHYRSGNWRQAKEALTISMKLNSGGSATDWYFLAMTCHRLGAVENARMWFERTEDRINSMPEPNNELQRFQKEAAEVLGQ